VQAKQDTHARHPLTMNDMIVRALPAIAALLTVAIEPATPALPTVPAEPATPALVRVASDLATPALRTVATDRTTPLDCTGVRRIQSIVMATSPSPFSTGADGLARLVTQ